MLQTADRFVKVCTEFYYLYLTSTAEGWYDKKGRKKNHHGMQQPATRLKNSRRSTRHSRLRTVIAQVYEVSRNNVIFEQCHLRNYLNDTSRSLSLVVNAILAYNSCVINLSNLSLPMSQSPSFCFLWSPLLIHSPVRKLFAAFHPRKQRMRPRPRPY